MIARLVFVVFVSILSASSFTTASLQSPLSPNIPTMADNADNKYAAAEAQGLSSGGGLATGFPGGLTGGGLGSSPLVPKTGSIDPKTGEPHKAGLTRAELQAKREAEAAAAENK